MTPYVFAKLVRKYTKQTPQSLQDSDIIDLATPIQDSLSEMIASRDLKGNYFILPSLTKLIASQREYAQPDDVLDHLFSIEVAFGATLDTFGELSYVRALPTDFQKWGDSRTEMNIQAHYGNSRGKVGYEIQRRSIYLYSGDITSTTLGASLITNGIRLRYRSYPVNLTDVSITTGNVSDMSVDPSPITFGFPRQFHELWARACAIQWKAEHPGAVPATAIEASYATDLEEKLQGMNNPDLLGETLATLPGSVDGNDGYDL